MTRFLDSPTLYIARMRDGLKSTGPLHSQVLVAVQRLADLIFYPCEHFAYLVDLKVISRKGGSLALWQWSCLFWGLSLFCSLLRQAETLLSSPQSVGVLREDLLRFVQDTADLLNAVHWMPKGVLWSGRLRPGTSALLCILSAAIALRRIVRARRSQA